MHSLAIRSQYVKINEGICKIKTVGLSKCGECLLAQSLKAVKQIV